MGTFKSTKTFFASPEIIPAIVKDITGTFTNEGYQVQAQDLISGGYDISITKGNMFKAVLGMKTALKVHIYPANEQIRVDAGVGIFGQQAVPTLISMFLFWPVLITQISGMIAQAKMDDKVMMIAADTIAREAYRNTNNNTAAPAGGKFCTQCGKRCLLKLFFVADAELNVVLGKLLQWGKKVYRALSGALIYCSICGTSQ